MSYSTTADVREMLKDDALNAIIGDAYIEDAAEREAKIVPIITEAIGDADGEIDGYLAKRYPTPLDPAPKIINKLSKDIAVYNLVSRIGITKATVLFPYCVMIILRHYIWIFFGLDAVRPR